MRFTLATCYVATMLALPSLARAGNPPLTVAEIYAGDASNPNAQYVTFDCESGPKTLFAGSSLRFLSRPNFVQTGSTAPTANDISKTAPQRFVFATQEAATLFGVTPDVIIVGAPIVGAGGRLDTGGLQGVLVRFNGSSHDWGGTAANPAIPPGMALIWNGMVGGGAAYSLGAPTLGGGIPVDAGVPDSSAVDAAEPDAGGLDAADPDAVAADAVAANDAAAPSDSGAPATDSGAPATDSGAPATDSGAPVTDSGAPARDSGAPVPDSGVPRADAGVTSGSDAGTSNNDDSGCGCRSSSTQGPGSVWLLLGLFVLFSARSTSTRRSYRSR
ncbi:MAG: hypothetical protein IT384_22625 [Deltaproteobacteria bacterium]|nr:hypothetical protein [Deltaproteobacteria bacterium]